MNENAMTNEATMTEDLKLYTLTELEPILKVSHRTLLEYVRIGRLKAVKIGGKWTVTKENLSKFVNGEV